MRNQNSTNKKKIAFKTLPRASFELKYQQNVVNTIKKHLCFFLYINIY